MQLSASLSFWHHTTDSTFTLHLVDFYSMKSSRFFLFFPPNKLLVLIPHSLPISVFLPSLSQHRFLFSPRRLFSPGASWVVSRNRWPLTGSGLARASTNPSFLWVFFPEQNTPLLWYGMSVGAMVFAAFLKAIKSANVQLFTFNSTYSSFSPLQLLSLPTNEREKKSLAICQGFFCLCLFFWWHLEF